MCTIILYILYTIIDSLYFKVHFKVMSIWSWKTESFVVKNQHWYTDVVTGILTLTLVYLDVVTGIHWCCHWYTDVVTGILMLSLVYWRCHWYTDAKLEHVTAFRATTWNKIQYLHRNTVTVHDKSDNRRTSEILRIFRQKLWQSQYAVTKLKEIPVLLVAQ
jgi:hypothetical protein